MTTEQPTFASTLEHLRLARGWNQAELARQLGVYPAEVSRWVHGGGISIPNVRKVAALFKVDPAELERLAGYGDSYGSIAQDSIDGRMSTVLDQELALMRERLAAIEPVWWAAICNAQREAGEKVLEVIRLAKRQLSGTPQISLPAGSPLAPPQKPQRKNTRRQQPREKGPLPESFRLVLQG